MNKTVLWITKTAMLVALLVVAQAATAALGNTLVTGSVVNMILIISVMTCGWKSGVTVAAISPICAKLFGIGPLWSILPFLMLGNTAIVLTWHFVGNRLIPFPLRIMQRKGVSYILALISGAVVKSAVLYLGIVQLAIPFLLDLPEKQAATISGMFSISQLITAIIGGAIAAAILPLLTRAIRRG